MPPKKPLIVEIIAFEEVDLVPNVLKDVSNIDISTVVMGLKLKMLLFALRLPYKDYFTFKEKKRLLGRRVILVLCFGIILTTTTLDKIKSLPNCPKIFQFYTIKIKVLTAL